MNCDYALTIMLRSLAKSSRTNNPEHAPVEVRLLLEVGVSGVESLPAEIVRLIINY